MIGDKGFEKLVFIPEKSSQFKVAGENVEKLFVGESVVGQLSKGHLMVQGVVIVLQEKEVLLQSAAVVHATCVVLMKPHQVWTELLTKVKKLC